ncbi:anti-lipopolysaccharide factor isoform X1 [Procambarus clarkii]|uniref:anti-lipopolysaccharide factor isoform X1 n=1 Tax=Procambarus clarkii TaxID=6728 RepID=UPI001E678CF0|nr:anti-lipopolysaccharide factor-like isoform X1 [Procambarus clarkii]XP_045608927.1 anti-lipopolysaccharide factor-like isoform X1 [Procambarus clarkii]XP_045608929.1 anti-lipopolysaccharide factor-like isoform X1 [Procambarus clarkii]XP_045608930.1 anti-lipopolysaccharide factor-like isoform X1 [Procambarus clarkii]
MRAWTLLTVVSLVVVVVLQQPCQAQIQVTPELIAGIIKKLVSLWKNGELEFMGHTCKYSYKPRISSWRLYYIGKMWCPGWASFSGESKTKSRTGSIEQATKDFVRKAVANNLITAEAAGDWLN